MGSDRTDNEPDEYDPEEEFRDPESDSLTIPRVSTEDAGSGIRSEIRDEFEAEEATEPAISTDETDVPPELLKTFWALVLFINGAVLAYALGALFLIFEGVTRAVGVSLLVGLVCTAFAVRRYRHYQRYADANDDGAEDESSAEASREEGATADESDVDT